MSPDTKGPICPLCKGPLVSAESVASRLCDNCQSIVKDILPGNDVRFMSTTPLRQPAAVQSAQVEQQASQIVFESTASDNSTPASESVISFDTGPLDEEAHLLQQTHVKSNGALESALRESGALEPAKSPTPSSLKDEFATLKRTAELNEPSSENSNGASSPPQQPAAQTNRPPENHVVQRPAPPPQPQRFATAAPPQPQHFAQAPAWNNQSQQWPVLVDEQPPASSGKWKLLVAAAVLFALVGAALAYVFVLKPKLSAASQRQAGAKPNPGNATAASPSGAASQPTRPATAGGDTKPAAGSAPGAETKPAAASAPSSQATSEAANPPDLSQAKFALQAASFPSAAAATEFSEKLVRAGVPAYVVAANLPGRGRWYRVRVGKFMTQEEANRFANDARLRAKSAGLTLQLVPCDYEKPEK